MTTILLINPNTSLATTQMMLAVARPFVGTEIALRGATAEAGTPMILDEEALAIAADEVVRIARQEAPDVDGIVVAAFGDPAVERLRATLGVPVVGIAETAMREAASEGRRFGIATTTPALVRAIEGRVFGLGLVERFTGIRVPPAHPLDLAAAPERQDEALAEAASRCLSEDGADAVVIGGGPLSGSAARLRERFPGRIVEPIPSAIRAILGAFDPP